MEQACVCVGTSERPPRWLQPAAVLPPVPQDDYPDPSKHPEVDGRPVQLKGGEDAHSAEESRLAHVAFTRAQKKLHLSYVRYNVAGWGVVKNVPSSIPRELARAGPACVRFVSQPVSDIERALRAALS